MGLRTTLLHERIAARAEELSRTRPPPVWKPGDFGLAIDTREKRELVFAENVYVEAKALATGDIALLGHETEAVIERKNRDDFIESTTWSAARFGRELERLTSFAFKAIVIEMSFDDVWAKRYQARVPPQTVLQIAATIHAKYMIPTYFIGSRAHCADFVVRLLRSYWKQHVLLPRNKERDEAKAIQKFKVET